MKKVLRKFSIEQNILFSSLAIVLIVLFLSSLIYYIVFSQRTDSLVKSQSKEIHKQILLNYETYINSVIETSNYIEKQLLNLELPKSNDQLEEIFFYNKQIKNDLVSIVLFDENGQKILGTSIFNMASEAVLKEFWFQNALKEKTIFHFSKPHFDNLSENRGEPIISVSKALEYREFQQSKTAILLIELNFKKLSDLAEKTNLREGGFLLILNRDDSLIYHSHNEDAEIVIKSESFSLIKREILGTFKASVNKRDMFFNINTLGKTRWRIVTVHNINELSLAQKQIQFIIAFVFIIVFIVTTLISILIGRRITEPIKQLNKQMIQIENGNFSSTVLISGQKELVLLSKSFNRMIKEIEKLMDQLVKEQKDKRKTELRALQNQINPHFLYNTLESIIWLAEEQRSPDVITMVSALAKFFRISISKGENFISIKEEISHIDSYLTIQKIRYADKFDYVFEVDESLYSQKIMKLILQPLVENAIYHGMGDDKEQIIIRAYVKNQKIIFEVQNSGLGVGQEKIQSILDSLENGRENTSVGMKNVYQRLKLFYGNDSDLQMISQLDEYTLVRLIIPKSGNRENYK